MFVIYLPTSRDFPLLLAYPFRLAQSTTNENRRRQNPTNGSESYSDQWGQGNVMTSTSVEFWSSRAACGCCDLCFNRKWSWFLGMYAIEWYACWICQYFMYALCLAGFWFLLRSCRFNWFPWVAFRVASESEYLFGGFLPIFVLNVLIYCIVTKFNDTLTHLSYFMMLCMRWLSKLVELWQWGRLTFE